MCYSGPTDKICTFPNNLPRFLSQLIEKQGLGWWLIFLISELGPTLSLPNTTAGHSQLAAPECTVFTLLFHLTVS